MALVISKSYVSCACTEYRVFAVIGLSLVNLKFYGKVRHLETFPTLFIDANYSS